MTFRWSRAAVFAGVAALISPIPVAAAMSATVNSQWSGTAAADGVRTGVVVNGFLFVDNIVDAGGPSAQAAVGSFTGSHALAAYPYPGEIVMTAHGQTSGAAPDYPLVAQTNNGGPSHSDVQHGPYDVKADSTDDKSAAVAQAGGEGGNAAVATTRSEAQVVHDPGTGVVTSTAESTIEGFSVAGVFSIGRVHSFARLASPASAGKPTSDTEFGDVRVGGQEVGVTDKGLVLPGSDVPLPPDSTANALLSSAGVTVHYLTGTTSTNSVVAPALSVSVVQNVPSVGETTVHYVIGQASVGAQAPTPTTGVGGPIGGAVGGASVPASSGGSGAPAGSAGLTSGGAVTGTAPVGGQAPQTAPASNGAGAPPYQLAANDGPSSQSLYLVVAAGALVAVAAAVLFRILAVKLAWT
jgi:hypothetical protein